jgi:hypothetical protein
MVRNANAEHSVQNYLSVATICMSQPSVIFSCPELVVEKNHCWSAFHGNWSVTVVISKKSITADQYRLNEKLLNGTSSVPNSKPGSQ